MHVAVNGWFLDRTETGSGQYLQRLLFHLPRRFPRLRLHVYMPTHGPGSPGKDDDLHAAYPGVRLTPVRLPPLPAGPAKLAWEQIMFPWLGRKADALWVPYWAAPYWQPCPTVVTIHDLIPQLLPAYRGGRLQHLYTRLVGVTARRAAAVLTVSHAAAQDIAAHLHISPARIHTVHHGAPRAGNEAQAAISPEALRARYGLPERYFLYLGGFDVRKNLETTLAAYARYLARGGDPDIRLVIAGKLPARDTPFAPDPRRLAAQHGLQNQVVFCGFVEEAHKPAVYAQAQAYIFPSLYEGFGMMVLEAMAAGAPVITSGPPPGKAAT